MTEARERFLHMLLNEEPLSTHKLLAEILVEYGAETLTDILRGIQSEQETDTGEGQ